MCVQGQAFGTRWKSLDFLRQKAGYLAFRRENSKENLINYDGKSFLTENEIECGSSYISLSSVYVID